MVAQHPHAVGLCFGPDHIKIGGSVEEAGEIRPKRQFLARRFDSLVLHVQLADGQSATIPMLSLAHLRSYSLKRQVNELETVARGVWGDDYYYRSGFY